MKSPALHAAILTVSMLQVGCPGQGTPSAFNAADGNLETSSVVITTDRTHYGEGSEIVLTILNRGTEPLAYNACTRELELWDGDEWVPGPASLRLCSREVWYAAPGVSRQDSTGLDLGLIPGEYRLVIGFTSDGAPEGTRLEGRSNPFVIDP